MGDREEERQVIERITVKDALDQIYEGAGCEEEEQVSEKYPPILGPFTKEQVEALNTPQIIQRIKGAKYILRADTDGKPPPPGMVAKLIADFEQWWTSDTPFLLTHLPVSIDVIMLPEVED